MPMGMGMLFVLKCQYKTEMVARLAELIEDWDTVRARKVQRGCRGLSDAGQATMLNVTEICSQKWRRLDVQTVIRCWLKAGILPREDCNVLKGMDTRLDREDKDDAAVIDGLCDMVSKMSMPAIVTDYRAGSPNDGQDVAYGVGDDPEVLEEEVELELQAVGRDLAGFETDEDVPSEECDGDGRPESCTTSSIDGEGISRLEDVRSYLYAKGRGGEYRET
ncbi:unnamed protein product [Ectocarpus sp. CCAP 1310/34]|nr:unnamed protein product [Ectocarpus sp. CCAP 1310/34]